MQIPKLLYCYYILCYLSRSVYMHHHYGVTLRLLVPIRALSSHPYPISSFLECLVAVSSMSRFMRCHNRDLDSSNEMIEVRTKNGTGAASFVRCVLTDVVQLTRIAGKPPGPLIDPY